MMMANTMNNHPKVFKWPITHPNGAFKAMNVLFRKGFPHFITCFKNKEENCP